MNLLIKISFFIFILWVLALILLWAFQEKFIFFPPKNSYEPFEYHKSQLQLTTKFAILEGWYINNKVNKSTVIFFDGNASDSGLRLAMLEQNLDVNLLVMHYRGYGRSTGKPSQKALFKDALALYDWLIKEQKIPPHQIFIMGYSLGSGVATYLASQRSIQGVILMAPYASIRALAKQQYPFFPIGLLLRNPFDSLKYAPKINSSALFFLAENDQMIPKQESMKLYQSWLGEKQIQIITDTSHINIFNLMVLDEINQFIINKSKLID